MNSRPHIANDDILKRTRWYIYLRWFILLTVIGPGLLSLYLGTGIDNRFWHDAYLGLAALASNAVFFILSRTLRRTSSLRYMISIVFLVDIALITFFLSTKGGIESRSVILYVLPIIMSSAIFGRRGAYILAAISIMAYDALLTCNYFGLFYSFDPSGITRQTDYAYVINSMIFFNSLIVLISMTVDFIARILSQKDEQASQHLSNLKRAQSLAHFGSWEWDKKADQITWSDELYKIFDIEKSKEPMSFGRYIGMIHPDDKERMEETIKESLIHGKPFSVDHRVLHRDGSIHYLHSDGELVYDAKGEIHMMIGTARDVTESKLLEIAKNDFVAITSHQLRTPATIVKQYTTMLAEGYAGEITDKQQEFVNRIYESNERQITIINGLLNIARIDSGDFSMDLARTNLADFLEAIVDESRIKFQAKEQKIFFTTKYTTLECEIDVSHLRMAVDNILDNAHKYSPAGKTIKIVLKRRKGEAIIQFIDQGIGIPAKDRHKVFEIFSRVDNPGAFHEEGAGIGLYWAKKIIAAHKGSISVAPNKAGEGTVISFYLPTRPLNDQVIASQPEAVLVPETS